MVLLRGRGPGTDFFAWPGSAELVICLCSAYMTLGLCCQNSYKNATALNHLHIISIIQQLHHKHQHLHPLQLS